MTQIKLDFPRLFEDDHLLVINKPYGVVVNRAKSVKDLTVEDWMGSEFSILNALTDGDKDDFLHRRGVVHRLDKETSGCLILAKTAHSFSQLQTFFKTRQVTKTYLALVHGKLVPNTGEINAPIDRLPWNPQHFGVVPGGKDSLTKYKVLKYFARPSSVNPQPFSLVELYPQTGRTHQIRVHLKYLGFPIVGDYLYAGRKQQKIDRKWCPRVFLHAQKIEFPHPVTGQTISCFAEIPVELKTALTTLSQISIA
ncbi:MAG: RluA family pseudouridine synthase [Patescibacteria group bacterium]